MSERNGKKQTRTDRAAKERGIKMARDQRREANRKTKQNKSPPSWVTDCIFKSKKGSPGLLTTKYVHHLVSPNPISPSRS
jgi:hypothetical protein